MGEGGQLEAATGPIRLQQEGKTWRGEQKEKKDEERFEVDIFEIFNIYNEFFSFHTFRTSTRNSTSTISLSISLVEPQKMSKSFYPHFKDLIYHQIFYKILQIYKFDNVSQTFEIKNFYKVNVYFVNTYKLSNISPS